MQKDESTPSLLYFLAICLGFLLVVVLVTTALSIGQFYTLPCLLSEQCSKDMKQAQWETFEYHQRDLLDSKQFLASYFNHTSLIRTPLDSSDKPLLCIGVISVKRKHQYVLRVLKSLLQGTERSDWDNVKFFVLNADRNWALNDDVESLSHVIEVKRSDEGRSGAQYFAKQNLDHAQALQICLETKAEFTVILEDDAVTVKGILNEVKQNIIKEVKAKQLTNWLWIKLYLNPASEFFSNQALVFIAFFGVSCGLIVYLVYVVTLLLSDSEKLLRRWNMPLIVLTIAGTIFIASIIIGYTNLPIDKHGIRPTGQNAYTVGMLYPSQVLPEIIEYVQDKAFSGEHIDILLGELAQSRHFQRFVYKPYLVDHVGHFSSRH